MVFDGNYFDVMYSRYFQEGKVLRVVRIDAYKGEGLALYLSENPAILYIEAFAKVDDMSPKCEVKKIEIRDDIWLGLLDGNSQEDILRVYERAYGDCYYFDRNKSMNTFRITKDTDEDEMIRKMSRNKN